MCSSRWKSSWQELRLSIVIGHTSRGSLFLCALSKIKTPRPVIRISGTMLSHMPGDTLPVPEQGLGDGFDRRCPHAVRNISVALLCLSITMCPHAKFNRSTTCKNCTSSSATTSIVLILYCPRVVKEDFMMMVNGVRCCCHLIGTTSGRNSRSNRSSCSILYRFSQG